MSSYEHDDKTAAGDDRTRRPMVALASGILVIDTCSHRQTKRACGRFTDPGALRARDLSGRARATRAHESGDCPSQHQGPGLANASHCFTKASVFWAWKRTVVLLRTSSGRPTPAFAIDKSCERN